MAKLNSRSRSRDHAYCNLWFPALQWRGGLFAMPGTPVDDQSITMDAPGVVSEEVAKLAIQDVARYQEQLSKLIFFHDEKGHKVLSVYVTVLAAIVTGAFALNQINKLNLYAQLFLGGAAASLLLGCAFAYITAWTSPIYIPGRKPDFWLWALENDQDVRETTIAYLSQAADTSRFNENLSNRSSKRLQKAYICGLAAPGVGAAAVWLAFWGLP